MSVHDLDALAFQENCQSLTVIQNTDSGTGIHDLPHLYPLTFSTHTDPGGVPGGGVPAGPGVRLAERGGGAPAAGRCRAGEEEGETGRASQANPGRGGEIG